VAPKLAVAHWLAGLLDAKGQGRAQAVEELQGCGHVC
jgi:hypothetical protein